MPRLKALDLSPETPIDAPGSSGDIGSSMLASINAAADEPLVNTPAPAADVLAVR
jgi:hypothetical protein